MQAPIINYNALSKKVLENEQKIKDGVSSEELDELRNSLAKKQDNLSFDGIYNSETNKAATVDTVVRKIAEIVANAPEDFNTLKELSDWLTSHEGSAAEMNSAIKQNAEDISELSEKVNSLPDEITFAGLPDKPFDGTEGIDIKRDVTKGSVNLKSGRIAHFQTENTYTADELIGATAVYCDDGTNINYSVTQSMIVDATADGMTVKVYDEYIFIAYTTNYTPAQANAPLPNVGVYFSYSDGYYVQSLFKEGTVTKRLDGKFVKLYKHTVKIFGQSGAGGEDYLDCSASFITSNSKQISTLQELSESPICAKGILQVSCPEYSVNSWDGRQGMRDVYKLYISNNTLHVEYITAYTIPVTTHEVAMNYYINIRDTVTEV